MNIQISFWAQARRYFSDFLESDSKVLRHADKLLELIAGASRSMQHQAGSDLFSMMGRLPNAPELAALLGRRIPVTAFGEASLGIKVAPTFRDALQMAVAFHHMVVPLVDYAFEEVGYEGRFTIGFRAPIDSRGEAMVVMCVACMIDTECQRYSGRTGNIKRMELTPSSKGFERGYRKELALAPNTDQARNVVVIDRAVLDLVNPIGDRDTYIAVMNAYSVRADLRDAHVSPATMVKERVMASIGNPPALASVAQSLQMTPRQLRLALARDDTNYQTIVRSCRIEYASALFRNPGLSLSQISERLGYSDLSAFTHAFCRWTGKSPSTFRIEMLSQSASL